MCSFIDDLTLDDAHAIVDGSLAVAPNETVLATCDAAFQRMRLCIDEARHVYGITTGFGPLANRLVDPANGVQLQQNLIHHLATGLGDPIPWKAARAICLARLSAILKGYSGASLGTIDALVAVLNSNLAPVLPERGTVGASGDLTPLAHLVLALQGRGAFLTREGETLSGTEGLSKMGLSPLSLENRDGLALVNGTSAMTGIALCNAEIAGRMIEHATRFSAAFLEVMQGRTEAWSPVLGQIRPHPGQISVIERLNACLDGASGSVTRYVSDRHLTNSEYRTEREAGQDAYSLRCVPQVIGAVQDALTWHNQTVEIELNAVTDNPVFPPDHPALAVHGGNFMGQHIGLVSDSLNTAIIVLAGLVERQIARLTDERLNRGLPAFLHRGAAGLNSGFMGAQVTASATLAEIRTRGSASTQSISTNAANQDVVSMGTIAARTVSKQLELLSEILSINALCIAQGMELRQAMTEQTFSRSAQRLHEMVRLQSPPLDEDRPLSKDIIAIAKVLRDN